MSEFNLSGSFIQDTYQRLIQIGSGSLVDGTGSALPISISGSDVSLTQSLSVANDITASGTISSSVILTGDLRVTGSAQFSGSLMFNAIAFTETAIATHAGDHVWGTTTGSSHYFSGSITASNNVQATNFYGNGSGLTNITASYVVGTSIVGSVDSALTASKMDYSGLIGTVHTWDQNTAGNAATATKLSSSVNINGVAFDGSVNITVPASGSTLSDTVPISKGGTGQTNSSSWSNHRITTNASGTLNYDGTTATAPHHDSLAGYVTKEHLDWSSDVSASATIHTNNIPTLNQDTDGTANNALTASFVTASKVFGIVASASNATNAINALTASYINAGTIGTVNNAAQADNAAAVGGMGITEFTLDYVTDNNNSTTNDITASAFVATTVSASGTIYAQALTIGGGASSTSTIASTNITASGHVSASNFYGDGTNLTGVGLDSNSNVSITSLTASSHISASSIYGTNLYISGSAQMSGSLMFNAISFTETAVATHTGDHVWGSTTESYHYFTGSITASGGISSSGAISASGVYVDGTLLTQGSVIELASIGESILPSADNTHSLGSVTKAWKEIYATNTYFGGIHEINIPADDLRSLPEGTILVISEAGLVPSTIYSDPLVTGVASLNSEHPLVMGAEPILVDGPINIGDFIVTSTRPGYGQAVTPTQLRSQNYHGCVIAQSLETSTGGLIKAMIRKM